ncbi:MAG: holin family protein [Tropicimonas sp.]|uniref:holin family protein n=1 Tax=Tropicimonas sp. TaxID=2067044 RepID=UPI003A8B54F3
MGLRRAILATLFGGGRNIVAETVGTFRENAENGAARDAARLETALAQFGAEFVPERRSGFDQAIDGLNRIPRPAMALGTLGLFVAAMVDPVWFASRMQGVALIPEPLWWLLGAIVGFYFGARHQVKGQEFRRSIAASMALAGQVTENIAALRALEAGSDAPATGDAETGENAALAEWKHAAE